jgi:hypothetical protein
MYKRCVLQGADGPIEIIITVQHCADLIVITKESRLQISILREKSIFRSNCRSTEQQFSPYDSA